MSLAAVLPPAAFLALLLCAACASPVPAAKPESPPVAVAAPAAAQAPSDRKALVAEAEAAFRRQEWANAARQFQELSRLSPDEPRFWNRLGYCRHALKDYSAAIEAFERVQQGPGLAHARYNIACGLALQGKRDAALDALDRAIASGFAEPATLAADEDLASLRETPRFRAALEKLQQTSKKKFVPPPEARQFDFWVGDWDVVAATGGPAGKSRVEKILGGAALQEHWTSASGNEGTSFNVWDPRKSEWRQHWIDDSGTESFYVGGFADGCMSLTAEQPAPDGKTALHRMRFFDLGKDGVRQWGEVSTDGGANWKTEYDLTYRRAHAR